MKYGYGSYGDIPLKDLESARAALGGATRLAMWGAQQAAEKMLKQAVLSLLPLGEERRHLLRSHSTKLIASRLSIPGLGEYVQALRDLDELYINTWYPGEDYFEVTEKEAEEYFSKAEAIVYLVGDYLSSRKTEPPNIEGELPQKIRGIFLD